MEIRVLRDREDDRFLSEHNLRQIAALYYEQGLSQEAIADMMQCSRQTIGKALTRAKDRGIIRISVMPALRTGYLHNMARDLRVNLGLEDLVLVPGRVPQDPETDSPADDVLSDISAAAAEYLDSLLTNKDILAVSGGKSIMRQVVRCLKPTKLLTGLQVLPAIGFVQPHTNFGDANLIAYDIAQAYGAKNAWLPIPAIVTSREQCEQARSLPLVRDVLEKLEQATVFITGLRRTS